MSFGLDAGERRAWAEDGYVVRPSVFGPADLAGLASACESVVADLSGRSSGATFEMGSYVFEVERTRGTVIKWEAADRDTMLGLEPVAHLHPAIERYAADARLVEPMAEALGVTEVGLYTEKLNLKRARSGGPIVLHQDYPYWVDVADDARRIGTAILFLDAAERGNGCLEVAPGSHRLGPLPGKSRADFGRFELEEPASDARDLVALEVPAGSIVLLGPFLVHRSAPNPSARDRRALLYSYQPAGLRHSREFVRIGG